jgi:hypothetical protein
LEDQTKICLGRCQEGYSLIKPPRGLTEEELQRQAATGIPEEIFLETEPAEHANISAKYQYGWLEDMYLRVCYIYLLHKDEDLSSQGCGAFFPLDISRLYFKNYMRLYT